jgi:hypothetical protein
MTGLTFQEAFKVTLPSGTKRRFQEATKRHGDSMSSVLRKAIEAYLAGDGWTDLQAWQDASTPPPVPDLHVGDRAILVAEVEIKRRRETPQGPRLEIYAEPFALEDFSVLPVARARLAAAAGRVEASP